MEIGNLNQRITILEHNTKIDSIGNHKAQWEKLFSFWAAVAVKSSSETTEAGVTKDVSSLEFTIRQTPDTMRINSTTHKILFRGLTYDMNSVIQITNHWTI